jgi:predicted RNA-binding protein with EMAP domain
VGEGVDVFEIQERVVEDVLGSVEHRQAVEAAPKILDDVQQLAATVLQAQRNNPALPARAVDEALQTLREPLPGAYVKDLREAYETYQRDGDVEALLDAVQELETTAEQEQEAASANQLTREELHLVCWEYVWS